MNPRRLRSAPASYAKCSRVVCEANAPRTNPLPFPQITTQHYSRRHTTQTKETATYHDNSVKNKRTARAKKKGSKEESESATQDGFPCHRANGARTKNKTKKSRRHRKRRRANERKRTGGAETPCGTTGPTKTHSRGEEWRGVREGTRRRKSRKEAQRSVQASPCSKFPAE